MKILQVVSTSLLGVWSYSFSYFDSYNYLRSSRLIEVSISPLTCSFTWVSTRVYDSCTLKFFLLHQTLYNGGEVWIRTTEGIANRFTVCPFNHSGTSPYWSALWKRSGNVCRNRTYIIRFGVWDSTIELTHFIYQKWSRERDSNPWMLSHRRFSRPLLSATQPSLDNTIKKSYFDTHL